MRKLEDAVKKKLVKIFLPRGWLGSKQLILTAQAGEKAPPMKFFRDS
jgi:hypothetical protein